MAAPETKLERQPGESRAGRNLKAAFRIFDRPPER